MQPLVTVKVKVIGQARFQFVRRSVTSQINVLVLHRSPKPFDEHVVQRPAATVHADLDTLLFKLASEISARELAALVGVENRRTAACCKRFFQCFDAKTRVQRVRQPPRQNTSTVPIHHRRQKQEPVGHRHVGYIRRPDMVGPQDRYTP